MIVIEEAREQRAGGRNYPFVGHNLHYFENRAGNVTVNTLPSPNFGL
jgi:hypothetical protein